MGSYIFNTYFKIDLRRCVLFKLDHVSLNIMASLILHLLPYKLCVYI